MNKNLLSLADLNSRDVEKILRRALHLKKERNRGRFPQSLKWKTLAMLFEKASTRTRVSFEIAMRELGGFTVTLESATTQVKRGESYSDTARVLSRYADGILIRTFGQEILEEVARAASIPVINGLTDLYHPCQILADLMTMREFKKKIDKVCYVGDGNNIANSWIEAANLLDFHLVVATPPGFGPPDVVLRRLGLRKSKPIVITNDPVEAVRDADVVNTDTWFSMGQAFDESKQKMFRPFQLNRKLMQQAKQDAIVLHCLPAHRGQEITDEVIDGPQSKVWDQAENRLHVQKAILEALLK